MKNKVQLALDELWAGVITYFHHDLLNHRLTFGVMVTKNVEVTTYKVSIDEISSIVFDDPSAYEEDNYEWEMMEVTSFNYSPACEFRYTSGLPEVPEDGNLERVVKEGMGSFNLLMEIFETGVYIHAKRLQINEKTFQLL